MATQRKNSLEQKIIDKIVDHVGNDIKHHSIVYAAKAAIEHGTLINPTLIHKMIICSMAQLFEDGKIILREES
jgi:hypothetical protein